MRSQLYNRYHQATSGTRGRFFCAALLLFFLPVTAAHAQAPASDQQGEIIGTIEGQAIALKGPMSVQVVGNEVKTQLRSGADVRVKTGQARIDLIGGGSITICGPAHISMLKAANGLTIALDSGTIHAHIDGAGLTLSIFTAQILAKSIPIADTPQDISVGFDSPGLMCVRANRGAVRLEEQFGNQSVLVPQGGDVVLPNGQLEALRSNSALCVCESGATLQARLPSSPELSVLASADEVKKSPAPAKTPAAPKAAPPAPEITKPAPEPTYQVYMPPLRYDASQTVQDEPDPKLVVLVRRVRVRPTLIFESRVVGDAVSPNAKSLSASAKPPNPPKAAAPTPNVTLVDRVKSFLKSLWTPNS